jgi:hypothetical protein
MLSLDTLVDFLSVHGYVLGGVDPNSDLISLDAQNCDGYVVTDHESFAYSACENKHLVSPRNVFLCAITFA